MIFDDFIKKYKEFLIVLIEKGESDQKAIEKFIEILEFLKPTTADRQEISKLSKEYGEALMAEQKALNQFTNSLVTLNHTLYKEDEIKTKITDLMEKIQSESVDQIQEQIEK